MTFNIESAALNCAFEVSSEQEGFLFSAQDEETQAFAQWHLHTHWRKASGAGRMLENSLNLLVQEVQCGLWTVYFLGVFRTAGLIKLKLCDNHGKAICDRFSTASSLL